MTGTDAHVVVADMAEDGAPFDLAQVGRDLAWVLHPRLDVPRSRQTIDAHARRLHSALSILVTLDLGIDRTDTGYERLYAMAEDALAQLDETGHWRVALTQPREWERCRQIAKSVRVFVALYRRRGARNPPKLEMSEPRPCGRMHDRKKQ
ncbi:hypothetical protein ACQB60_43865 [Actinomycetota bacterium Odt1-20B]